jgi:two-component system response regulator DesR
MPHPSKPPGNMGDAAPSAGESETTANGRISVLIAERRASYRICLSQLLKATPDLRVAAALADGMVVVREALRLRPHVVIAAARPRGMSGVEIARCLRALAPGTATILLLERADEREVRIARDAGAVPLVLPDVDVLDIVGMVRALGQGRAVAETITAEIDAPR